MKSEFVKTTNYIKLVEAFATLDNLPNDTPKMGLGYGSFGLGKTFALEKIASNRDLILLRAGQSWTNSSVITKLCIELDIDQNGKTSEKYDKIVASLIAEPKTIIVDEVDTLLKSDKNSILELFRDIHDEAKNVIFFIGMEESNGKFKRHSHYYSRLTVLLKFRNIEANDIRKFCELSDVKIEDDLVAHFAKKYPNLRQVKVFLVRIEEYCEMQSLASMDIRLFNKEFENAKR